jgi:hypothetical protein
MALRPCYFAQEMGSSALKRSLWIFVFFSLFAVVGASLIPQPDLPETSYDEADMPVNQAAPVVLGVRFVPPVTIAVPVPSKTREVPAQGLVATPDELISNAVPYHHPPRFLNNLLCTLLI